MKPTKPMRLGGPWVACLIIGLMWSGVLPTNAAWMSLIFSFSLLGVLVPTIAANRGGG